MTKKKAISILRKWRNIGTKDMTSERLGYIEGWFGKDDSEAFAMAIQALQEQKVGHWQITDAYPHNVYCSKCHKKFAQTHWAVWNDEEEPLPRNYCPNCGAEMEGADE